MKGNAEWYFEAIYRRTINSMILRSRMWNDSHKLRKKKKFLVTETN